jgi:hypothetical protein
MKRDVEISSLHYASRILSWFRIQNHRLYDWCMSVLKPHEKTMGYIWHYAEEGNGIILLPAVGNVLFSRKLGVLL